MMLIAMSDLVNREGAMRISHNAERVSALEDLFEFCVNNGYRDARDTASNAVQPMSVRW